MANLAKIADSQERLMLAVFNDIVADVKDQVVLQEVVNALEVGNVDAVIELLGLDESTWQPMGEAIRSAYIEGGITGASQIGKIPTDVGSLVLRFNVGNPTAAAWISNQSSKLITEVSQDQVEMVRERLRDSLDRGENPRKAALELVGRINPATKKREGGFIGLTKQQAGWIANARAELENLDESYFQRSLRDKRLDKAIRKAMESGTPIPQKTLDAAINRMQQRALKYRADTIARTESINALRAGQYESIAQAVEKGRLNPDDVIKKWDASGDTRTRPAHTLAEFQYKDGVGLGDFFIVDGEPMAYPGDPAGSAKNVINCRCKLIAEIDFGKKLARLEGFS